MGTLDQSPAELSIPASEDLDNSDVPVAGTVRRKESGTLQGRHTAQFPRSSQCSHYQGRAPKARWCPCLWEVLLRAGSAAAPGESQMATAVASHQDYSPMSVSLWFLMYSASSKFPAIIATCRARNHRFQCQLHKHGFLRASVLKSCPHFMSVAVTDTQRRKGLFGLQF